MPATEILNSLRLGPMLVFAAIMPHPPESIPGVGTPGQFAAIKKTLHSFEQLRKDFEKTDPDTIMIISPHAHLEPYSFMINSDSELRGSFAGFGLDKVLEYENNVEIADKLGFACAMNDLVCHLREDFLDHGALIPLYHLTKNVHPKVVHLAFSLMSYERHYRYGQVIRKIIDSSSLGRVAVVASGDLSHCLTPEAPSGFRLEAKKFDQDVLHFLGSDDIASLMHIEPEVLSEVRECGLRSIMILLGILHEKKYKFNLLSYEAPFGVGYLTARML